jgi:hypothetical protein
MRGMKELRHRKSRWSFSRAADREIAQANYRHPGLPAPRPHPQSRHRAIKRSQRR